jgi:hypothetical protein
MTILIPVMMGVIGLAIDGSRLFILNTEQADLADAAALAAARELDRTAAGVVAAVDAAHNVVTNDPRWASDAEPEFHLSSVLFCPDQWCATTMDLAEAQMSPAEARFVQVTTEIRLLTPSFLAAVGAVDSRSNAIAVAGSSMVACNVTPLMMCESVDPDILQPGVMFELKGDSQLGPGAFALIDPAGMTSSGANLTLRLLASTAPNFCYVNDVSVATGQRTSSIQKGLNVRWDMYPPGNEGNVLVGLYPPAPNVTKGKDHSMNGPNCSFSDVSGPNELLAMPLDNCFNSGTCDKTGDGTNSSYGDGNWDRDAYWNANHSTKVKPTGWDNFTRYQTYLWELDPDADGEPQYSNMPSRLSAQEDPEPLCYPTKGGVGTGDIDRRSLYVAVADCSLISGNATPDLESARYGEFFLVRPSEGGEIRAEFVRWIEPDDDTGVLRRIIQLYR